MSMGSSRVHGLHHLLLQCSDLGASEHFYLDLLGFAVRKREQFRDGRPFVSTQQGLGLVGAQESASPNRGVLEHFCFAAHDVDGIAVRVSEAGFRIVRGPGPGPYGHTVYVADPDGNEVELFEQQ